MVGVICRRRSSGTLGSHGAVIHWQPTSGHGASSSSSSSDDVCKPQLTSMETGSLDGDISILHEEFPTLSEQDCARFREYTLENGGTEDILIEKLKNYVQFRKMYHLDSQESFGVNCSDEEDWEWASNVAIHAARTCKEDLIPGLVGLAKFEDRLCNLDKLPRMCFMHKNKDGSHAACKDGLPFIQYLAARLDLKNASGDVYALAMTLYLERKSRKVDLDGTGKGMVLMIDSRRGAGWPNHLIFAIVSYLKILTSAFVQVHPGRSAKFIIYPVPYALSYVVKVFKRWLPPAFAENVILLNGSDGIKDPAPKKLVKYVDEDILEKMEETRFLNYNK
ncbi:expressed unknown protein [Seminavis robusta]|uniref:CRAL-TRIO domain-containing protein n=1 Tax=Seminavis robusta TaxID=568900 RepID=A0A9N8DMU3_9STRA|nr:expressed unknown protein [Seminavis robusta]|eukprot:Sro142_g066310.1 n/a (335) ;mRNA; r:72357-73444